MVEPREPEEMPDLSPELGALTLREVGEITVRDVDEQPHQTAMMWKSVAAENLDQRDTPPQLPAGLRDRSEQEILDRDLAAFDGKAQLMQVMEWFVFHHLRD